jgi:hypothetical protein
MCPGESKQTELDEGPRRRQAVDVPMSASIRHLVRPQPVDLLGHGAVERPEAGLHMRHADALLHRDQRPGQRRVHVPHDDDPVRAAPRPAPAPAAASPPPSGPRACRRPPPGCSRAPAARTPRRTRPTSRRRSAGRCGSASGSRPRGRTPRGRWARSWGSWGVRPTMCIIFVDIAPKVLGGGAIDYPWVGTLRTEALAAASRYP